MPALVELTVVGQVALHRDAQDLPPVHDHPAVEQGIGDPERGTRHHEHVEPCSGLPQLVQGTEHRALEGVLEEEILARVARQTELGKNGQHTLPGVRRADQVEGPVRIEPRVCDPKFRNARGRTDEAVTVYVQEVIPRARTISAHGRRTFSHTLYYTSENANRQMNLTISCLYSCHNFYTFDVRAEGVQVIAGA